MNHSTNQTPVTNRNFFGHYDTIKHNMRHFYERGLNEDYVQPIYYSRFITSGSSNWLTKNQMAHFGLIYYAEGKKHCPYLGYVPTSIFGPSAYILARSPAIVSFSSIEELPDSNGHILTIAPTRAGKGSGQIIPNLLIWQGSVIVLDIKAENYNNSAGYRAKELGQTVHTFALLAEGGDVFNPILSIRANLNWAESTMEERCNEEEDVSFIENLVITPSDGYEDSFWEGSAKSFLKGLMLHVRTAELLANTDDFNDPDLQHRVRERSMRELRRLICLEPDSFASLLEDMGESKRPLIREAGNNLKKLMSGDGKTGLSILAAAKEQTKVWSFERVHQATYKPSGNPDGEPAPNDFTFEQLRNGKTSIYLIVPPEYLSMYRPVLRVIVGCALRELKDSHSKANDNDKPPVLFILDEFPQLGYMRPIEEALAYIAGYGVRLWLFVQDIAQLRLHYKNSWPTFIANTDTKCFFGVNDIETANWVSEMLGATTVDDFTYTSGSSNTTSGYGNTSYTDSSSHTTTHVSRRLKTSDEIMRMPYHEEIILIKGLKPIRCDRPGYYDCNILNERSKIAPLKPIDF